MFVVVVVKIQAFGLAYQSDHGAACYRVELIFTFHVV